TGRRRGEKGCESCACEQANRTCVTVALSLSPASSVPGDLSLFPSVCLTHAHAAGLDSWTPAARPAAGSPFACPTLGRPVDPTLRLPAHAVLRTPAPEAHWLGKKKHLCLPGRRDSASPPTTGATPRTSNCRHNTLQSRTHARTHRTLARGANRNRQDLMSGTLQLLLASHPTFLRLADAATSRDAATASALCAGQPGDLARPTDCPGDRKFGLDATTTTARPAAKSATRQPSDSTPPVGHDDAATRCTLRPRSESVSPRVATQPPIGEF
ncbi:unnamed protein product, partial [Protopolystoma xenopodis]